MIRDFWQAGAIDELDQGLLVDCLSNEDRSGLGKIHPSFMGGEYLPDYAEGELEIARIELESTTTDVISIRAKKMASESHIRLSTSMKQNSTYLPRIAKSR